jgi:hypothetical protein
LGVVLGGGFAEKYGRVYETRLKAYGLRHKEGRDREERTTEAQRPQRKDRTTKDTKSK